jgi:hypothetical protein
MSYLLDSTTIKRPQGMQEDNNTQTAQNRTLSGAIARDQFGSNKRVWTLRYANITKADFDIINTIYQSYLSTGTTKAWQVTETNYSISLTSVHINLDTRGFSVGGDQYISEFTLILTEA